MKPYHFLADGNQRVVIGDGEVSFRPVLADMSLLRQHWPRAEIIAVSAGSSGGGRRRRCEVSVTRSDGTVRSFRNVHADAAEVLSAFTVRGYPVQGQQPGYAAPPPPGWPPQAPGYPQQGYPPQPPQGGWPGQPPQQRWLRVRRGLYRFHAAVRHMPKGVHARTSHHGAKAGPSSQRSATTTRNAPDSAPRRLEESRAFMLMH